MNFISKNITDNDKNLFFGENEVFNIIDDNWVMAHILHVAGIFSSISQARKNGWDKPIPLGFTILEVGKKAKKRNLFILRIDDGK